MQTQTSLYIPKPCHEDWNKMTPTQQGKFCGSCNKQVIDFSLMSDQQVLNFLSHQSGKLCGRFGADQLQRPLIETKIKKKKSWWMALMMPLLFLFDRSEAQSRSQLTGDTIYNTAPFKETINEQLVGKVAVCGLSKKTTITGKVVDENNENVPFATVFQKGTHNAVKADNKGNFSLEINTNSKEITLSVSCVGFMPVEKVIYTHNATQSINIIIKQSKILSGDVVVTMGYAVKCKPIKKLDTTKAIVKRIFKISAPNIYPNPAVNNGLLNIQLKTAGEYQMQLFDNQSRLIQTEEINVASEKATAQIQLSSNIAAGIYYMRLINEQTKKHYTEKLIIQ